jgi:hypothetical protein
MKERMAAVPERSAVEDVIVAEAGELFGRQVEISSVEDLEVQTQTLEKPSTDEGVRRKIGAIQ